MEPQRSQPPESKRTDPEDARQAKASRDKEPRERKAAREEEAEQRQSKGKENKEPRQAERSSLQPGTPQSRESEGVRARETKDPSRPVLETNNPREAMQAEASGGSLYGRQAKSSSDETKNPGEAIRPGRFEGKESPQRGKSAAAPNNKRCRDVMNSPAHTCDESATAADCASLMQDENIGLLPVVNDSGKLIGVVTDRDLAIKVLAQGRQSSTKIKDIMTSASLITCSLEDPLTAAEDKMSKAQKSRVVVVDKANKPQGVISLSDVARAEPRERAGEILNNVTRREARPRMATR